MVKFHRVSLREPAIFLCHTRDLRDEELDHAEGHIEAAHARDHGIPTVSKGPWYTTGRYGGGVQASRRTADQKAPATTSNMTTTAPLLKALRTFPGDVVDDCDDWNACDNEG